MAKSTFSGPVKSLSGFISAGVGNSVSLTADTTLTVAAHAGKILLCNDADGKFTLPPINISVPTDATDPNHDGSKKAFVPGAANDVMTMNGSTKGGIAGSVVRITAIDAVTYLVHDSLLIGSGTIVTPFADA
jgi:hypothetical protein